MNGNRSTPQTLVETRFIGSKWQRRLAADRMNAVTTSRRRGFTLLELLVTVTIIAILAALTAGAVFAARDQAREAKTKALIAKIHRAVMDRHESYRTRRVPLRIVGSMPDKPHAMAVLRLQGLREIMRLEMPERWADLAPDPLAPPPTPNPQVPVVNPLSGDPILDNGSPPRAYSFPVPALAQAYRRRYNQAKLKVEAKYGVGTNFGEGTERLNRYSSAECLYMIVAMGGGADARDQFHDSEIGDADDDGLYEFHDGWGNPILFLRWAPGVTESDVQTQTFFPDPSDPLSYLPDLSLPNGAVRVAVLEDHDPFDSRNLYPFDESNPLGWPYAYRLVPFIYSAGPDGIYDINPEDDPTVGEFYVCKYMPSSSQFRGLGDPFFYLDGGNWKENDAGIPLDRANVSVTAPGPANGSLDHYDNIHNHRLEAD